MLLIECPWCGQRDEIEFSYGGEAGLSRPDDDCSDAEWANYLYMRTNTRGIHRERWYHAGGCRQWFTIQRDTTTNRIIDTEQSPLPERAVTGKVA